MKHWIIRSSVSSKIDLNSLAHSPAARTAVILQIIQTIERRPAGTFRQNFTHVPRPNPPEPSLSDDIPFKSQQCGENFEYGHFFIGATRRSRISPGGRRRGGAIIFF